MFRSTKTKAVVFVTLIVLATILFFFATGYLIAFVFRIPRSLALPVPVRLSGFILVALSLALLAWLLRCRKPINVVVTTYITIVKALGRTPKMKRSKTKEPLIIGGPYKYLRHPIYFSVFFLLLGSWLLVDYSFLLFSALLLLLWFRFAIIPFEEKELLEIFGSQYEEYMREVPGLIPFSKRHKPDKLQ